MASQASSQVELPLRAVIDAVPSGLLLVDGDGRIVLANRQVERMFGYAREELLGSPVEMLVPERFAAIHVRQREEFVKEGRSRSMAAGEELIGLAKDGAEIPLDIGLTPIGTDEGFFVLAAIVDITARKRAEDRFRVAVESSPNGMLMIGQDGRIVLVNREIERMFGYSRDELLGQPVEILVPRSSQALHPAQRDAYFHAPQARAMGMGRDLFGMRKDGALIPVEIGLNPIVTEEGVFVLGSVVDISARKRAELEHRQLEEQLRQAQKMEAIGRLASGIAHDFNNVLMGIIACGELAKHELPPGSPAQSIVGDICGAAERGASLSRDLLNFSRRKPVEAVPSELNAIVRVAERMLRKMIGEDVVLTVELCPSGGPILGNPTHLEHILLNLVVNARDAMPNGGRLRIATRDLELATPLATRGRTLPAGSYVSLEVEDSGIGMDTATRERLFEPFFTTKEVGTGTGLGLYTVYSIVDQLQGGVEVRSEPGKGALFAIHLPRLRDSVGEAGGPRVRPDSKPSPTARILLVEDERLIRSTLQQLLVRHGYHVIAFETAAEAIAATRNPEQAVDLLLSDMVLPDSSGADLAEVLKRARPDLKVLFMSAYPADLLVQQGRIRPGTRTLEKPFDEQTLALAVRTTLRADGED
jgi:PAS domain S-box-containing protein